MIPSNSPGENHLNPTGTSSSAPTGGGHDPVDDAAADERLPHRRAVGPAGPVREQVADRHREVVIRDSAARPTASRCRGDRRRDRSPNGEAIAVLQREQARHGVRAGAVHPDPAVVIGRHEREGGIGHRVHHRDVEPVRSTRWAPSTAPPRRPARPPPRCSPAARIASMSSTLREVVDVGRDEVVLVRRRGLQRCRRAAPGPRRRCRRAAGRWPGPGSSGSRRCRRAPVRAGCT